jgi:hypothetical protein
VVADPVAGAGSGVQYRREVCPAPVADRGEVGEPTLEFVNHTEVAALLQEYGYLEVPDGEARLYLRMPDQERAVHLHVRTEKSQADPLEGAEVIELATSDLPGFVEQVVGRLNLIDLLLIPVGKWRNVFDAVAFSLASNEAWQEFDTAATVELNTRDPILCGPMDVHVVIEVIRALINDAESPDQGLMITATATPVLVEVVPDGALRLSLGSRVLADEVMDVVGG